MSSRSCRRIVFLALLLIPGVLLGQSTGLADLPLHEVPRLTSGGVLAVLFTGDGNWAKLVRTVAHSLASQGVATVGVDSRTWLTHGRAKGPQSAAADLERIIRFYQPRWGGDTLLILGYSRGAEIVPFAVRGLPPDLRRRIGEIVLLAPSPTANFTFHFTDLFRDHVRPDDIPLAPVLDALGDIRVLCIHGADEKSSLCDRTLPENVRILSTSGGHHFDGDYPALADSALRLLRHPDP